MPANSGRFQCVSTDDAVRLIADELGIDIQELERKRQAKIEAEAQEKIRRREEAEAEARARRQESRRAFIADALASGAIRAWRSDPKKDKMVDVRRVEDLQCPECGEAPEIMLDILREGFYDAAAGHTCNGPWFDRGLMTPRRCIRKVPGYRVTVPCTCGLKTTYTLVCMPKEE